MSLYYQSEIGQGLHSVAIKEIEQIIRKIEFEVPDCLSAEISMVQESFCKQLIATEGDDAILNDQCRLSGLFDFFKTYLKYWQTLLSGAYKKSWDCLQDGLDELRFIRRHVGINLPYFQHQLVGIERCYPYRVFASIGMEYGYSECSICGNDVDSDACPHRLGELYKGKMAYGTIREVISLDHVALVTNPKDKRCVMELADTPAVFTVLNEIIGWVGARKVPILCIAGTEVEKRVRANPESAGLGRNDRCFCGSEKKFKRCCISKKNIEYDHLIVGLSSPPEFLLSEDQEQVKGGRPKHVNI